MTRCLLRFDDSFSDLIFDLADKLGEYRFFIHGKFVTALNWMALVWILVSQIDIECCYWSFYHALNLDILKWQKHVFTLGDFLVVAKQAR